MYFQREASKVSVLAPAKINLFLELLGKRPDQFHELETVMVAVSLMDRVEFTPTVDRTIHLECVWEAGEIAQACALASEAQLLGELPPAETNLAYRAARLLQQQENVRHGARIVLRKRIPAAAGFGGASSDAAAVLLAANLAWDLNLPRARLSELAAQLGSDVPFFLITGQLGSGQAVATGRGEKIAPFAGQRLDIVLIRPPGGLSTAEVYGNCQIPPSPHSADVLKQQLIANRRALPRLLVNRLSEPARKLSPKIDSLAAVCEKLEGAPHQMSGSGSGYFVLCRHRRHARRLSSRLKAQGVGRVHAVTTCGMRSLRH